MVHMPTNRATDGITASPSISRQFSDEASAALTMNAIRIPMTTISWFSDVTAPRIEVGATSER